MQKHSGFDRQRRHRSRPQPGSPPGSLAPQESSPCEIAIHTLTGSGWTHAKYGEGSPPQESADAHTWIDVQGIDTGKIKALFRQLGIHKLVFEDVVNVYQEPKCQSVAGWTFVVLNQHHYRNKTLTSEQISILWKQSCVITLQQSSTIFDQVLSRHTCSESGELPDFSFLPYIMVDHVIDHLFPVVGTVSEVLEASEALLMDHSSRVGMVELTAIKKVANVLDRNILFSNEVLANLIKKITQDSAHTLLPYYQDCHDHLRQISSQLRQIKDDAGELLSLHMSIQSMRLNQTMWYLTVISGVFLPMSFIAGVYGMNFDRAFPWNMPELGWEYGYLFSLGLMVLSGGVMLRLSKR